MNKFMAPLLLTLSLIGGCSKVARAELRTNSLATPLSICSIDMIHRDSGSETAALEGVVLNTAEGNYLEDDHCPDAIVRLRLPLERTVQNGARELGELIASTGSAHVAHGRVHCVCSGRLEFTLGLPVLNVDRVEKVWTSNP